MAIDPVRAVEIHRGLKKLLAEARAAGPGSEKYDELEQAIDRIVELAHPDIPRPLKWKDENGIFEVGDALVESSTDLVKKLAANN